jgi:hypothetical protein
LVVQPAENWAAKNLPGAFDGTQNGASFSKARRQQQVAEVAFAEHERPARFNR